MNTALRSDPVLRPSSPEWWATGTLVVSAHGDEAGSMRLDFDFGVARSVDSVREHVRLQLPGETDLLAPTEVDGSGGHFSVSFFSSDIANASQLPADAALYWTADGDELLSSRLMIVDADVAQKQAGSAAGEVHQPVDRYPKTLLIAAVAGVIMIALGIVIYFLTAQL